MDQKDILKEITTNPNDMLQNVKKLQQSMPQLSGNVEIGFNMTDALQLERNLILKGMVKKLKSQLLLRIPSLPNKEEFLAETFPYIRDENYQEIVFAVMVGMNSIPHTYISLLKEDDLFTICPLDIQRKVYESDVEFFLRRVEPIIQDFVSVKMDLVIYEYPNYDLQKERKNSTIFQELERIIGDSMILYNYFLDLLRNKYETTSNRRYCRIRREFLLYLIENQRSLSRKDPLAKLAQTIDHWINYSAEFVPKIAIVDDLSRKFIFNDTFIQYLSYLRRIYEQFYTKSFIWKDIAMVMSCDLFRKVLIQTIFHLLINTKKESIVKQQSFRDLVRKPISVSDTLMLHSFNNVEYATITLVQSFLLTEYLHDYLSGNAAPSLPSTLTSTITLFLPYIRDLNHHPESQSREPTVIKINNGSIRLKLNFQEPERGNVETGEDPWKVSPFFQFTLPRKLLLITCISLYQKNHINNLAILLEYLCEEKRFLEFFVQETSLLIDWLAIKDISHEQYQILHEFFVSKIALPFYEHLDPAIIASLRMLPKDKLDFDKLKMEYDKKV